VTKLRVPIDVGDGPPILLLHGFAMRPETYRGLVDQLSPWCRMIVPDLFDVPERWTFEGVLDGVTALLDERGIDRVSLLAHSFGGGILLGFASRSPQRAVELIFSDTLADSREWGLAAEALRHPARLLWLATPRATKAFFTNTLVHPRQLIDGGLWAFRSNREAEIRDVAGAHIPAHVLWANRDSILSRPDGQSFARDVGASFTLADPGPGRVVDHDWMFEQPALFVEHLEKLGLEALST
jgi:pimeloyl-ACP methyl ester carboxylesterase